MPSHDVLVIGAGHNGLAAAVRLAQGGRRVLVLERWTSPGGLCGRHQIAPGYAVPGLLHDSSTLAAPVVDRLGLAAHGLQREATRPAIWAAAPDGPGLLLATDPEAARDELARYEPRDVEAYARWRAFLAEVRRPLLGLLHRPPPPLAPGSFAELGRLGLQGLALRRLGRRTLAELLRLPPMCVADWLNESFAGPLLKELLAAPAVMSTLLGPWSAGSAANLLLYETAADRPVTGGPAALVAALLAACHREGVEVRCDAEVRRIRTAGGRVAGVDLADGEPIDAPVVAAACDPRKTLLDLLAPGQLGARLEQQVRSFRCRGTAAKVHLALAGPLEIAARPGERIAHLRIGGGHLDALERAFDAAKYRRLPARPHLDVTVPSVTTQGLAPDGHHVVSILASFVPHDLAGGWSAARRDELGEAVVATLERHAPGLRELIVAREVLTPVDLEQRWALTGGHLHHGEHALDQLLSMRPVAAAARYRTPVPGLFLAGSGSHPGGGVSGMPGLLAAEAVLGDS